MSKKVHNMVGDSMSCLSIQVGPRKILYRCSFCEDHHDYSDVRRLTPVSSICKWCRDSRGGLPPWHALKVLPLIMRAEIWGMDHVVKATTNEVLNR